jgi:hypothetical protein
MLRCCCVWLPDHARFVDNGSTGGQSVPGRQVAVAAQREIGGVRPRGSGRQQYPWPLAWLGSSCGPGGEGARTRRSVCLSGASCAESSSSLSQCQTEGSHQGAQLAAQIAAPGSTSSVAVCQAWDVRYPER